MLAALLGGGATAPGESYGQTTQGNRAIYELMNRMTQLEQELRQLRGDMERYQYYQKDILRRLEAMESQAAGTTTAPALGGPDAAEQGQAPAGSQQPGDPAGPAGPGGQTATTAPAQPPGVPAQPSVGSDRDAYDAAFNHLRQGQYEQAITGFEGFLATYPDSVLAANAHYWLGETYYVLRDYPKAQGAFLQLGAKFPKSDKLPEAMLKLGYIYEVQGNKEKAGQVFRKLMQVYPNSRAAGLAEERLRAL